MSQEYFPMNAMMLCNYPLSRSEIRGGTSSATYNLVHYLRKYTPVEITVFTILKGEEKAKDFVDSEAGIRIIRCPLRMRYSAVIGLLPEKLIFGKVLKKVNPDIVHAQGMDLYASLATTSKKPNVFTIHGLRLREIEIEKADTGFLRYWLQKRLILRNLARAKNIVAINRYTNEETARLHKARVWVIRNPIDEDYFEICKKQSPDRGRLLLVGGVRERKDVLTALTVIVELMETNTLTRLDIVGPVETDYAKKVESFIRSHDLGNYVTIHGLVPDRELKELYRRADIFLLTSLEESSPISIVQAMAAGKPVVSTDVGGISEIVRDNQNGNLHPVKDTEGLAMSLRELIIRRGKRERYSELGHKIALQEWSPRSVAMATYEMYKQIASH